MKTVLQKLAAQQPRQTHLSGGLVKKTDRLFNDVENNLQLSGSLLGDVFLHIEDIAKAAIEGSPDYKRDIQKTADGLTRDLDKELTNIQRAMKNVMDIHDEFMGKMGEMTDL